MYSEHLEFEKNRLNAAQRRNALAWELQLHKGVYNVPVASADKIFSPLPASVHPQFPYLRNKEKCLYITD